MFDYIERFYNAKRRHSTIGYMSPMEFEVPEFAIFLPFLLRVTIFREIILPPGDPRVTVLGRMMRRSSRRNC